MKRTKHGFTLVELLVVISIIGILMSLLIPAVNAARETARRNQCSTNVLNLSLAAIQYENTKGYLPSYIQKYGVFPGGNDRSDPLNFMGTVPRHVKAGGYGVSLLPWLDAQPTYEHWTQDSYPILADNTPNALGSTAQVGISQSGEGFHTLATPNLGIFQCPSNPVTDADNGRNSYVSNNGMCWIRTGASNSCSPGTSELTISQAESQKIPNGISFNQYLGDPQTIPAGVSLGPRARLTDIKDGQGYTALYTENVQALPWYLPGFLNGPDLVVTAPATDVDFNVVNPVLPQGKMLGAQFAAGWVWHYEDDKLPGCSPFASSNLPNANMINVQPVYTKHRINGAGVTTADDVFTLQMSLTNAPDLARPSSAHVEGVNVGFADGRVRFIQASVDYRVFQAIMTPRGKSSYVPWPEYVITDEVAAD